MENKIPVGSKAPVSQDTAINLPTRRKFIGKLLPGAMFTGFGLLHKSANERNEAPKTKDLVNELANTGVPILTGLGLITYAWSELIINIESKKKILLELDKLLPKIHENFMRALEVYENISFRSGNEAGKASNNPWQEYAHPEIKEEVYKNLEIVINYGTDEFSELAELIYKKLKNFDKQYEQNLKNQNESS